MLANLGWREKHDVWVADFTNVIKPDPFCVSYPGRFCLMKADYGAPIRYLNRALNIPDLSRWKDQDCTLG